ncbi:MAG: hypothetical protein IK044_00905 [Methanobrevibacter sp.]|nr:hypothetical protein [Methanobrevibacter sp.]
MGYLNELDDELLEEIVYEYEDELQEMDVDEIIANLKNNISDYIFENPEEEIPLEPFDDIDFGFEEKIIPDEVLEEMEPKDNILDYVDK